MSSPEQMAQLQAIKAALSAPNMREMMLPTRAAGGKMFTYEEALDFVEKALLAFHRTPRLPINVTSSREDGRLTIRVTPDHP